MSTLPPQEVIDAIENGTSRVTRRLEFYQSDGTVLWAPKYDIGNRLIDGTVTIDQGRDERRTFEISADNIDNALRPNEIDGLWYDKVVKLYKGIDYTYQGQSLNWEVQMGEFMIDKIDEDNFPHITKLAGRDYTKKCMNSKFGVSTSFPEGTLVVQTIKNIAINAGVTKFRLPVSTESLTSILAIDRTQTRWEIMKLLATSYGYDIYFDNLGFLTLRKFNDPSTSPVAWTFLTGSKGNLVKWSRSTNDSRLYNHIIVTGEGGDDGTLPFFGEALNTEPSSPTRIKRIGDRSYFYTSSFFTSDQQCYDLANAWLKVYALESYESNWDSFNYPWMEVGEIVGFIDPRRSAHEPTRYLLDTLSIPMGLGVMSATAKRVTIVGPGALEAPPKIVVSTYTPVANNMLIPVGIVSAQAFGNPIIPPTLINAQPTGIASAQAVGTPVIGQIGSPAITVSPTGIATGEVFGVPTRTGGIVAAPVGIASAEVVPVISVLAKITPAPVGIVSAQAFGVPVIQGVFGTTVSPTGIVSAQAAGNPVLLPKITVNPTGIASAQALGQPTINITSTGGFTPRFPGDPGAGRYYIGWDQPNPGGVDIAQGKVYEQNQTAIYHTYSAITNRRVDGAKLDIGIANDCVPSQSFKLGATSSSETASAARILTGAHDADIAASIATVQARAPHPIWLCYWHEPEDFVTTLALGQSYRDAFRYIVQKFRDAGVTNVMWSTILQSPYDFWAPGAGRSDYPAGGDWRMFHPDWKGTNTNTSADWYTGSQKMIDVMGLNVYDPLVSHAAATNREFNVLVGDAITKMLSQGWPRTPIWISEFGVSNIATPTPNWSTWFTSAKSYVLANDIVGISYWDGLQTAAPTSSDQLAYDFNATNDPTGAKLTGFRILCAAATTYPPPNVSSGIQAPRVLAEEAVVDVVTSTTYTTTLTGAAAVGERAWYYCAMDAGVTAQVIPVMTLTDSKGNTWTQCQAPVRDGSTPGGATTMLVGFTCVVGAGKALAAGDTVTLHYGSDGWGCTRHATSIFSAVGAAGALDQGAVYQGVATAALTVGPTGTTTLADEIVIAAWCSGARPGPPPFAVGAGYTQLGNPQATAVGTVDRQLSMEYKIINATGAQTATATISSSSTNCGSILTFKAG